MRLLIILTLLTSCVGHDLIKPDGCQRNEEVEFIESEGLCMDSIRCVTGGIESISSYFCVCDGLCICFFSTLENCPSIYDESCDKEGGMLLLSDLFCMSDEKFNVLEELSKRAKEVLEE